MQSVDPLKLCLYSGRSKKHPLRQLWSFSGSTYPGRYQASYNIDNVAYEERAVIDD